MDFKKLSKVADANGYEAEARGNKGQEWYEGYHSEGMDMANACLEDAWNENTGVMGISALLRGWGILGWAVDVWTDKDFMKKWDMYVELVKRTNDVIKSKGDDTLTAELERFCEPMEETR